ncbi:helix-turn-helix domain-containing protein [Sanguibacter keddieii]|uniref:helix-turn-helix domain-containing protein n=1 Tax=Sanguibacter keddieii TaxID=60920 RepID=UPI00065FFC35|nr:helix-turn-helix domain-containing protein [Sanguibacter keddieii]
MEQQSAPRFMTVTEVADIMRVSKMTVYRLIHSGEMPAIRVGKSFRVPEAAVTQMIQAGMADHSGDQARVIGG